MAVSSDSVYITIGTDFTQSSEKSLFNVADIIQNKDISVIKVDKKELYKLSAHMHDSFHRCGGYVVHESRDKAIESLFDDSKRSLAANGLFVDYSITMQTFVEPMVKKVEEEKIRDVIKSLSAFKNRFYKSPHGVKSSNWIKDKWADLSSHRTDVTIEAYDHKKWPQPTIIMTVEGSELADEILIIGGHADSISGWFGGSHITAPGADDNASGIATITEVIRVMMDSNYRPKRTVKFMAYAAEEVGLLGSKELASNFEKNSQNVVGVMQLDMTNHKGTSDKDIVMMNDFTNAAQNAFLGTLIDEYVKVPWGYSKCGYGCSDHASWHNKGFPASMPFESTMEDINKKIHTKSDTIDQSGGNADHAVKFAKLALSYLVEMGK